VASAVSLSILPMMNGGKDAKDARGAPFASLTVSGASADFPASGIPKLMAVLEEEGSQIAKRMPAAG